MGKHMHVAASAATETTTGVERGLDVDVTVTIDGIDHEGEVTLLPDEQTGEYGAWGQPANWISGSLLRVLETEFSGSDFRGALSQIESAARATG